ncbi:MAG: hypothetical protein ACM3UN_02080 [Bacillota bacterium]
MSGKVKKSEIEKEYNDYNLAIERKAQNEIKKIKERIDQLKKEAEKIGETIEFEGDKEQSSK